MKSFVIGKIYVEGFHHYPTPPEEVNFLSYRHRHTFDITFTFEVSHDDREKEIFVVREIVYKYLVGKYTDPEFRLNPLEFGAMSCEMIAKDILNKFQWQGMVDCEVWEEKTGGAKVSLNDS